MTARRLRTPVALSCFLFAAIAAPAHAQEPAQEAGPAAEAQEAQPAAQAQEAQPQTYRAYREELIAQGWKPDVKYGLKTANGKALYRFPEVVCGPQLCSGKWRDKTGAEKLIPILRGDGKEEYRLAP